MEGVVIFDAESQGKWDFEQHKQGSNQLKTNSLGKKDEPKVNKLAITTKHFWVLQIVFAIFIVNS